VAHPLLHPVQPPNGIYHGAVTGYGAALLYVTSARQALALSVRPSSRFTIAGHPTSPWGVPLGATIVAVVRNGAITTLDAQRLTIPTGFVAGDKGRSHISPRAMPRTTTTVVTSAHDSGPGSLRDAIANASVGDTITFAADLGAIVVTTGELVISKTLTIQGPAGTTQLIQGSSSAGVPTHRLLEVLAGTQVTLANVTLAGGHSPMGGGILNSGTLTVTHSIISGNAGDGNGGGIANTGVLTVHDSTIATNSGGTGGGIANVGGTAIVDTSTLAQNDGDGIANISGTVSITASTMTGNNAPYGAGVVNVTGTIGITSSTILSNQAGTYFAPATDLNGNGGGVANISGTVSISASTVAGNRTGNGNADNQTSHDAGFGGGLYNNATMTIVNSTVSGNAGGLGQESGYNASVGTAGGSGGGIYNDGGALSIRATSIVSNTGGLGGGGYPTYGNGNSPHNGAGGGPGGGIYNAGTVSISISTIAGNAAGNGGAGSPAYGASRGGSGGTGGAGGGLYNTGTVNMRASTVAHNASGTGGDHGAGTPAGIPGPDGSNGGIDNTGDGSVTMNGTIVAANHASTNPDCGGSLTSTGYNLVQDSTGCSIGGDLTGTNTGQDPKLGPLRDNGGPTSTEMPADASPAIDQIPAALCSATPDQRGAVRPDDHEGGCDLGAVEAGATPPPPYSPVVTPDVVQNDQSDGPGSLRDTIARAHPGDTITFSPSLGTISLINGDVPLTKPLEIIGPTAYRQDISGVFSAGRVFDVDAGVRATLANVVIRDGHADQGGGILTGGTLTIANSVITDNFSGTPGGYDSVPGSGGGIANVGGALTIDDSTISHNGTGVGKSFRCALAQRATLDTGHRASTGTVNGEVYPFDGGPGGGIANISGTLTIRTSLIADNTTGDGGDNECGGAGDSGGFGGGIYTTGALVMSNSTVTGNTTGRASYAGSPGGSGGSGSGIANNGGIVRITNSTITGNRTGTDTALVSQGGGINNQGGMTTISDTIVATNTATAGPDCAGTMTVDGYNLVQNTSGCTLVGTTAQTTTGVDPRLGPVQDNGGPTETTMPLDRSPAIDVIPLASCGIALDQRGNVRPDNSEGSCDIGAVESVTSTAAQPAGNCGWVRDCIFATYQPGVTTPNWYPNKGGSGNTSTDVPSVVLPYVSGTQENINFGSYDPQATYDYTLTFDARAIAAGDADAQLYVGFEPNDCSYNWFRLYASQGWQHFTVTGHSDPSGVTTNPPGAVRGPGPPPAVCFLNEYGNHATEEVAHPTLTIAKNGHVVPPPTSTLEVSAGAVPGAFFPQGGQTASITGTVVGPEGDPTLGRTSVSENVTVYDGSGSAVKTLPIDKGSAAPLNHWTWDGSADAGHLAPPGAYTAVLSARTTSGLTGTASVPITVQADAPIPLPCQLGVGGDGGPNGRTNPRPQRHAAGVNTQSGDYATSAQDLAPIPAGAGLSLEWRRYYNSQCSGAGPFGPGWTFTYDEHLTISPDGSTVVHVLEDGQRVTYTRQPDGGYRVQGTVPGAGPSRDDLIYDAASGHYRATYCSHGCGADFDAQGRLVALTDPEGGPDQAAVALSYDGNGLVAVTNTVGQRLTVTSDPTTGMISAMRDPSGRIWRYGYDVGGYLRTVTNPDGSVTRYSYGATGRYTSSVAVRRPAHAVTKATAAVVRPAVDSGYLPLTTVQDAVGGTTAITYDANGRATNVADALGETTAFSYTTALTDASGTGPITATIVIDPLHGSHRDYYDDHERLRASVDPAGQVMRQNVDLAFDPIGTVMTGTQGLLRSEASYDADGNEIRATDGAGDVSTNSYDALGDLTSSTDERGFTTGNAYDARGDLLTSTDALGVQTSSATYDASGNQTSQTDAAGHTTTYGYDASGNQISSTDALSHTTGASYDALGHPLVVTDAAGHVTRYAYDDLGRATAVTDTFGNATRYGYDALGHTVAVTDALGGVTRSAYDTASHLLTGTDALGNQTTYGYDALGRTVAVTDALGGTTRSYYDDNSRLVSATDALGQRTVLNHYDSAGQLVERDDALGHPTSYAYDLAGRLVTQTDARGDTTTYGYDALGRTIAVTNPLGDVTQSAYDGDGRLITQEDALGQQTTYGYDALGQTVALTNAVGDVTRSYYDAAGRLVSATDALGYPTTYGYDALGRTVAVTDALGGVTRSAYDAAGRLLTGTDVLGHTTVYGYDALGRTAAVTDPSGAVARSAYDLAGRLVTSTDALGYPTTYGYDALGRTVAVTDPLGGVMRTRYDGDGRTAAQVDALGDTTAYGYDALGHQVTVTNADGYASATGYDALGRAVAVTDTLGHVTATGYDALGRTTAVTDALGNVTGSAYDADGRLVTSVDALGNPTSYAYDALGRTGVVTDALGDSMASTYDADGRLMTRWDALGNPTSYNYDALGRTVAVTDALGHVTSSAYDAAGRVVTSTDALGYRTVNSYDALGRTVAVTDALGGVAHSQYDLDGRLRTSVDALGNPTAYSYDALGHTVAVTDALGHATHSVYDLAGRPRASTDALGYRTVYGYDPMGQTVAVTDPLGGVSRNAYDAGGHLVAQADALGYRTVYGYDALGRQTAVTNANGHVTTTGYDALGHTVAVTDAVGNVARYAYDPLGRTAVVTDAAGNTNGSAYDPAGRLVTSTNALGYQTIHGYDALGREVSATDALGHTTYGGYDADGRLVSSTDALGNVTRTGYDALGHTVAVTNALGGVTRSAYDLTGRVVTGTDALGGVSATGYDALGRTVAVTDALGRVTRSAYDAAGRLVTSVDALGHPTSDGYDALGRTVAVTDALGHVTDSRYDLAGRLVAATDARGQATGYGYDPAGNRTVMTNALGYATRYGYDAAERLVTTIDPLGHQTVDGLDALGRTVVVTDATGRRTSTWYDADGRTVATDNGAGNATETGYDALGRAVVVTDGAGRVTTRGYDADGRPVTSADALGDTTTTGYDALGRTVAVTDPLLRATMYGYDALGRSVAVTDPAGDVARYGYDALGETVTVTDPNGHARTTAYDAGGHPVTSTDPLGRQTLYGYDALGNTVTITDGNGHVAATQYDQDSQPLTTTYTDGSLVSHGYDALGQQITLGTRNTGVTWAYDAAGRTTDVTETIAASAASTPADRAYTLGFAPRAVSSRTGGALAPLAPLVPASTREGVGRDGMHVAGSAGVLSIPTAGLARAYSSGAAERSNAARALALGPNRAFGALPPAPPPAFRQTLGVRLAPPAVRTPSLAQTQGRTRGGIARAPARKPRPLPTLALTLTNNPALLAQFELSRVTASLARPIGDGRITVTLRRAGASIVLASCAPTRGRCDAAWSTGTIGKVTIATRWTGDRRYAPATAALTIDVRPARYTYRGTWQGAPVGPLTRIPANDAALAGATLAGRLRAFRTDDPAYTCLNGRALDVYTAHAFPGDYVAHSAARGTTCPAGTWLFPQQLALTSVRPASGAPGTTVTLRGALTSAEPDAALVPFFAHGTLRGTAAVLSWNSHTATARVPAGLHAGAYTVRIDGYDRLTGATLHSNIIAFKVTAPAPPLAPTAVSTQPVPRPATITPVVSTAQASPTRTVAPQASPTVTPPANPTATTVPPTVVPPTATRITAPTATPTATSTPSATATSTATSTPSATPTVAATDTPFPTATATPTAMAAVPTPSFTPVPTGTSTTVAATTTPMPTAVPTATPMPSTETPSASPATTATPINTGTPTASATDMVSPSTPTTTPATPTTIATTVAPTTPTASASSVVMHLGYGYDAANRRTSMTYPDGKTQGWSYDAAGRVSSIAPPGGGTPYTIGHDGAGNLTRLSAPNGGTERWSYDAAGRLTGTDWISGTTTLFSQTATLDRAGQRRVLHDSWGVTTYGYDTAGRLTSASYPDGTTEQDGYDAAGNRLTITNTSAVSGPGVTHNGYDAADQLTTSAGPNGTTTYSYDGNGNQTGSSGPNGVTTNAFNDLKQLTGVTNSNTNERFVYDGQGDRLQSIEQAGPVPIVHNNAQDTVRGLSALASDGQTDYSYLQPGSGQAPLSGYNQGTVRTTYLATDLLGSVRLATDNANTIIGAGAYDAWGNARPTMATTDSQTLLAGLRASVPFGYAGQQYDAGAGTYNMRARHYDPHTGRFLSVDPLVEQTVQAYIYADNNPTNAVDPSGLYSSGQQVDGYIGSTQSFEHSGILNSAITLVQNDFVYRDQPTHLLGGTAPASFANLTARDRSSAQADLVSFLPFADTQGALVGLIYNVVADYSQNNGNGGTHTFPDDAIARLSNLQAVTRLSDLRVGGRSLEAILRAHHSLPPCVSSSDKVKLYQGTTYPDSAESAFIGFVASQHHQWTIGIAPVIQIDTTAGSTPAKVFARQLGSDGIIGVSLCEKGDWAFATACFVPCPGLDTGCEAQRQSAAENAVPAPFRLLDTVVTGGAITSAIACQDSAVDCLVSSEAGLALAFIPPCHVPGLGAICRGAVRVGGRLLDSRAGNALRDVLTNAGNSAVKVAKRAGRGVTTRFASSEERNALFETLAQLVCPISGPRCFPAGTLVATPRGETTIEKLHIGDLVLSEDPQSKAVQAEPVEAVITRTVSPLIAVDLSDHSSIKVQPNHAFWVDGGRHLSHAGWLQAGQMQPGDRLRTVTGKEVLVVDLRWNVGRAVVYTLTVAKDHTFFVGTALVLVHNARICPVLPREDREQLAASWWKGPNNSDQLDALDQHWAGHGVGVYMDEREYTEAALEVYAQRRQFVRRQGLGDDHVRLANGSFGTRVRGDTGTGIYYKGQIVTFSPRGT